MVDGAFEQKDAKIAKAGEVVVVVEMGSSGRWGNLKIEVRVAIG
jgi:hypothetical protein